MGILGGGYYLHNISLPIIRNAEKPENNVRDVFLGYFLVFLSYAICGFFGYYGFSGTYFTQNGQKEILSNCLLMFDPSNPFAIVIRFCVFVQLLVSLSLLFACQRQQIYLVYYGNQDQRSQKQTIFVNSLILILPFILAVFYPQVGKLAGYLGSVSGLFCIYVLPVITHLKALHTEINHPILSEALKNNDFTVSQASPSQSPLIAVGDRYLNRTTKNYGSEAERRKKFYISLGLGILIIVLGCFVVIA